MRLNTDLLCVVLIQSVQLSLLCINFWFVDTHEFVVKAIGHLLVNGGF